MSNGNLWMSMPANEPLKSYLKGSPERIALEAKIEELKNEVIDIPLIIGGKEIRTGILRDCTSPHNNKHVLGRYHMATEKELNLAVEKSLEAKKKWFQMSWEHRAAIFLKAAELLSGPWRATLNAATILGQSKTPYQAEIDSACELIDFLRFNAYYMQEIYNEQPFSTNNECNKLQYRALEGFVLAVTPFNFTAIGGNLATAPAMMGNVVNWKPADKAVYSNYFFMKILQEAGLPDGVINFIPCTGQQISKILVPNKHLSGVHFTGSTDVFQQIWQNVGQNIDSYLDYPRLVGETGGKDFVFAHNSCDKKALVTALVRGAFEFQGQKCSAASRAYIPASIWEDVRAMMAEDVAGIEVGDAASFTTFVSAVIDNKSFDKIKGYIEDAKASDVAEVIIGGKCDDSVGYFVEPTVILTRDPHYKSIEEEIFGPVLTVYVYEDEDFDATLEMCDNTSPYGLTGAIFAQDRNVIEKMESILTYAAGNFYINDKPTGAVVGQQPFGGARKSGTDDKAGSKLNLYRWCSARTIKENRVPPTNYKYGYMME